MSREAHYESVAACQASLQEVADTALGMKEKQVELIGLLAQATGGADCPVEGGRTAFEMAAVLGERIEEFARICDNIATSLENYGAGF